MTKFRFFERRWLILLAAMLAFLPVVIDMTILHIAMPSLTLALAASGTEVLWIIDIYPLLMAGLLVPMGTLADRVGDRRVLLTGLGVFGLASLLAAFSVSPAMLIGARVLLALGGSMIMPCVLGIIRRTFADEQERAIALGLWSMVGAAGAAMGPLIGGMLLAHFWWGSAFLINVPVMLLVAPAVFLLLPRGESTAAGNWALGQALLLIAGVITSVYGFKAAIAGNLPALQGIVVLLAGSALLNVFVRQQLNSPTPMLDLTLFSRPAIVAGIIMAVGATGALAGVELSLVQELQYVLGKTPLEAGVFMLPIMIAAAVGGPLGGYLSRYLGLRWLAGMSMAFSAIALLCLAGSDFDSPGLAVPGLLAVLGLALSIGFTASSIAIMGSVAAEQGSAAGSLEATSYELGSGLGISLFGVFMSAIYSRGIALPVGLSRAQVEQASRSISDSYVVAQGLAEMPAAALLMAARAAFTSTHSLLLASAGGLMGVLALAVLLMLRNYRPSEQRRLRS